MSVDFDSSKQRWRARWREQGRQRARRFSTREEAHVFDESLRAEVETTGPGPAIRREALDATRVHEPARRGDGAPTPRGIDRARAKSRSPARSIATFWLRLLEERRPYMTKGLVRGLRDARPQTPVAELGRDPARARRRASGAALDGRDGRPRRVWRAGTEDRQQRPYLPFGRALRSPAPWAAEPQPMHCRAGAARRPGRAGLPPT